MFNATFNNISVISWQSVLLVEETWLPGENHWPVASHWQILSHNVVSSTLPWAGFELSTLVVIGNDCIGSCKSNYHTITTTTTTALDLIDYQYMQCSLSFLAVWQKYYYRYMIDWLGLTQTLAVIQLYCGKNKFYGIFGKSKFTEDSLAASTVIFLITINCFWWEQNTTFIICTL